MRFHVPGWALAPVFGRDVLYGYRWEQGLGRFSVVGTTVKEAERWAHDWVADEKQSRLEGRTIDIATPAAAGCSLGASVSDSASEEGVHRADGVFAEAARDGAPDDAPEAVDTDGWAATQGAWMHLFPNIAVILCFLPAFLKLRERATQTLNEDFEEVSRRVGEAYRAQGTARFAQRLRRLRAWAERTLPDSPMKTPTRDLCRTRGRFSGCDDHARAHRTRNRVDRLMRVLDRACFNAQYFHGSLASAELRVRALAVLWNLCPSSPMTVRQYQGQSCPAERLNGKRYADHGLENLLASGSMNGLKRCQQNSL